MFRLILVGQGGDPEPVAEKYPWIENFKNPGQRPLRYVSRYVSIGDGAFDSPISINKPNFRSDGSLYLEVDHFSLRDEQPVAELFSTIRDTYVINDDGSMPMIGRH